MNAVNFSLDPQERYTFWSGLLGGSFLMLSYFGTDQSQVQRYITGSSLRESRLGLLFNAVCKIPMQLFILMIGVLIFVFYQFEKPPLFFDKASGSNIEIVAEEQDKYSNLHESKRKQLMQWLDARHRGDDANAKLAFAQALNTQEQMSSIRDRASEKIKAANKEAKKANDADYVFITFILQQFPHGMIGLLIAAFFAATLSSKAAELNALGACSSVDIYRFIWRNASDKTCLVVARIFTVFWGLLAICVALYAHLVENLIQAVNILGSIFYGVILGIFMIAFFVKRVHGNAVFWASLLSQACIFWLFAINLVSYLWYPLIGCTICIGLSLLFQASIDMGKRQRQDEGILKS
jgi:Na+/proline symporter